MPNPKVYGYQYDPDDPYVYKGTNVLVNKFGLTDFDELWKVEREL
ncbi:hypothetical protein [Adlercreutzia sp. ZJ242]|nr:hypothetical protein [Adlercreutzia sp. ZJ242]